MRLPVFVAVVLILAGCDRRADGLDDLATVARELADAATADPARGPALALNEHIAHDA